MNKRLYVGGLPRGVDGPGLAAMFAPHGAVLSAEVAEGCWTDGASRKRSRRARRESPGVRGYGFVEMGTEEGARAVVDALNGWGGWLVVREAKLSSAERRARRKAKLETRREAERERERAKTPETRRAEQEAARTRHEAKLAKQQRLADELVGALESRFPQDAFHVEELEVCGWSRRTSTPVVAVKLCMAGGGYMLEGTVRELADGLAEEMEGMLQDGATCPFCGAEGPRHRFRADGRCACGAAAYWEDESPRWPIRVDRRGAADLAGAPLTPRAMTASRGFVSAGRGLDGLRMWFAPPGAVPDKADLPPPTGWPAALDDVEMLVRSVLRDDISSDGIHAKASWLARMASGGAEYVTRSSGAFVAGLRPGGVVRMSATVEGPDRSHPADPSGMKCGDPGVLVLKRCRPPRGSRAPGGSAA